MNEAASRIQSLSEQARLHDAALSRLADYAEDIRKLTEEVARLRGAGYAQGYKDGMEEGARVAGIMRDNLLARAALSASAAGSEVSTASNSVES